MWWEVTMLGHKDHKRDNYTEQERRALTNFRDFLKKIIACGNMRGKIHISSELKWLIILYNAHGSHIKSTSFQKFSRRFERKTAHKHITPCKHSIWPLFMAIQELNFRLKTKERFLYTLSCSFLFATYLFPALWTKFFLSAGSSTVRGCECVRSRILKRKTEHSHLKCTIFRWQLKDLSNNADRYWNHVPSKVVYPDWVKNIQPRNKESSSRRKHQMREGTTLKGEEATHSSHSTESNICSMIGSRYCCSSSPRKMPSPRNSFRLKL